ncbi:hypothetical protein [Nocardia sp. NPDC057668]|uniref:hypothetical protein n=1 Tax=Nocardia sp. NPDC057668 TaxID=3346202 RepID=UPI00366C41AE
MVDPRIAGTALIALALPILFAPNATAEVSSIAVLDESMYETCGEASNGCTVLVTATGADKEDLLTVSINGVVVSERTPVYSHLRSKYVVELSWRPTAAGTYTLTATQGTSTRTTRFTVCPEILASTGSAPFAACKVTAGSAEAAGSAAG